MQARTPSFRCLKIEECGPALPGQHLDVSIRFFQHLRRCEGLFTLAHCRAGTGPLDTRQKT